MSKMVKLEHNTDGFGVEDTKTRQTILNAADTVYVKSEKKKISLVMEPFEYLILFHNRKLPEEVFVNLLENAMKYMEDNGTITIVVHLYELIIY